MATPIVSEACRALCEWSIRARSTTSGASGVIFGWITYLIVRGFLSRKWGHIVVALVVLLVYGSALLGVFPASPTVSWQGHLGGAIGGALAAWLLYRREVRRNKARPVI